MSTVGNVELLAKGEREVITIGGDGTILDAARKMREQDVGSVVGVDRYNQPVGILTEHDIVRRVVADAIDPSRTNVADAMTCRILSCRMSTEIGQAQQTMAKYHIRHLPIIEEGRVLGMVSSRDILAYQLLTVETLARRQTKILTHLERHYPGITRLQTDQAGRLVI